MVYSTEPCTKPFGFSLLKYVLLNVEQSPREVKGIDDRVRIASLSLIDPLNLTAQLLWWLVSLIYYGWLGKSLGLTRLVGWWATLPKGEGVKKKRRCRLGFKWLQSHAAAKSSPCDIISIWPQINGNFSLLFSVSQWHHQSALIISSLPM